MILHDRQDCTEFLARILDQTQAWRQKKAVEYADDPRNEKAAEMLDQLAIDAANLIDEQFAQLQPHFGWSSQIFRASVIQAAKSVGFSHRNRSSHSFVRLVGLACPLSAVFHK